MFLPLKIAVRFLKSGKGQTILITLGIAIGVSVQIFIGLLIQGLQNSLIDKTIGSSSQITITSAGTSKVIDNYNEVLELVNNTNGVKYASLSIDGAGFVEIEGSYDSVLIRGMDIDASDNIYKFSSALIAGRLPASDNEIIIGKKLAELLAIELNDNIDILIPEKGLKRVKICGIFDLKVVALNRTWVVSGLTTAQNLLERGDVVTSVEIQINDVFNSDILAAEIKEALGGEVNVTDWQSQNEELLSGLNGQSVSSIMIQVFVIIAVVLGIASVLAISVLQKSKQLGILKAMGIKDGSASLVFLLQGLILGLMGAITGVIIGLLLIFAFTSFALNPDGTPLIPLLINYNFIAMSAGIALVASMIAALIPAVRSSRLDPIEVIKNG